MILFLGKSLFSHNINVGSDMVLENCSCIYYDEKTSETVLLNENTEICRIKKKPEKLFEQWCLENGSTLEGRLANFRYELNVKQKPCILVNEPGFILFIPTMSMSSTKCMYFQYRKINRIKTWKIGNCCIETKNGTNYYLDMDVRVLRKQFLRAKEYTNNLRKRNQKYILMEMKAWYNTFGE